ncbi:MAG: DUF4142 domain-containing protein [Gammaproteobacteria bacterium]
MKIKPIMAVMPVMFTLLTGCKSWEQASSNAPWPFHHHHAMNMQAWGNGEIIQDFISLNKAEIAVAKVAKMRAHCPSIRHFAQMMINDHSHNLHRIHHVSHEIGIAPTASHESARIDEKGQHEVAKLKAVASHDFDRTFLDDMIRCHQHALQKLDKAIMDSTNPKLTTYLRETHKAVSMHLQKAEALRQKCGVKS